MIAFSIERQPYDINGQLYKLTINTTDTSWTRYLPEEDMERIEEITDQALNGATPTHMDNWRSEKYPDGDMADMAERSASVFNLAVLPNQRYLLTISECADVTIKLRWIDLHTLHKAVQDALDPETAVFGDGEGIPRPMSAMTLQMPSDLQKEISGYCTEHDLDLDAFLTSALKAQLEDES